MLIPPALQSLLVTLNDNVWDEASWQAVFDRVSKLPVDVARDYYELFFKMFPHSASHWCRYIDHERKVGTENSMLLLACYFGGG